MTALATTLVLYLVAALLEIAGCFALWAVVRLDQSRLWLIPGIVALALFGWVLTRIDSDFAGRAYAAYGGIYIAASLGWLWAVEHTVPSRTDVIGAGVCLVGVMVILMGARQG